MKKIIRFIFKFNRISALTLMGQPHACLNKQHLSDKSLFSPVKHKLNQTMEKGAILPVFYLPPISYFSLILECRNNLLLEKFENFPKQTFRNRACIYSPNGPLNLIIPVIKGSKTHTQMKDVKISYDFRWQRIHWMSLQTCYRSSAYFEFYEADFVKFYEQKWDYLFDYNLEILELLFRLLRLGEFSPSFTSEYHSAHDDNFIDFRNSLQAKTTSDYTPKPYFQLFGDRHGYISNLSIADLLFNQGPQSLSYI